MNEKVWAAALTVIVVALILAMSRCSSLEKQVFMRCVDSGNDPLQCAAARRNQL